MPVTRAGGETVYVRSDKVDAAPVLATFDETGNRGARDLKREDISGAPEGSGFWETGFGAYLRNSYDGLARGAKAVREATDPFQYAGAAAQGAASMLPGAGVVEAHRDFGRMGQALKEGRYGDAAIDAGYGLVNAGSEFIPAMAALPAVRRPSLHPDADFGAAYYRRTNNPSGPANPAAGGMMQFARDPGQIENYGKNLYGFDPPAEGGVVDASSSEFRKALYRAIRKSDEEDIYRATGLNNSPSTARQIVDEANPARIVNSAGTWDNQHLVERIWNDVLEPNGWNAVTTNDGAVVFDESLVRLLKKYGWVPGAAIPAAALAELQGEQRREEGL